MSRLPWHPISNEPTLFDNVRASDPATSKLAAALDRTPLRVRVDQALRTAGQHGATDWELTDALGLDRADKPSVGKRRQEVAAVNSGRTRPSPKGLPTVVWLHRSFAWAAREAS